MHSDPEQTAEFEAFGALIKRDLLKVIFDASQALTLVLDADSLSILAANPFALKVIDRSLRDARRMTLFDLFPRVHRGRAERLLERLPARGERPIKLVLKQFPKGLGSAVVTLQYVRGEKDSIVVSALCPSTAMLPDRRAELAEERLSSAIEAMSDGFVFFDHNDQLVLYNQKYRELYALSEPSIKAGAKFEDIIRYGLKNGQYSIGFNSPETWLAKRLEAHQSCETIAEQRLSDGRWLQVIERATSDGGRVGLRKDITNQKRREIEMRRQSRTDELTGLFNRRGLMNQLRVLGGGLREGESLALFLIDLDRFRSVNDVYGHDAGNLLLRACSKRLSDFRPQPDAVARLGSDEFAIAIHGTHDEDSLLRMAGQLIQKLNEPVYYEQQSLQVGASIGICSITQKNLERMNDRVTASDIALNEAKKEGGNFAVIFRNQMRDAIVENIEVAKDIRRGLEEDEFAPHFQPQIDTLTNTVVGFEALIRWDHQEKGMVPAFKFLHIAQRVGLTDALDDLVMDKSVQAVRQLRDWGLSSPSISINLSIAQISDPRILRRLQTHLDRHGVEPENIRVELLESTLLDDRASVIVENVHKLIRAGFEVELDDFGTGHAALATLRKFQVSRIKVDRSLVANIDKDSELQVITSALIDLAQNLGIDALAEGVETREEQEKLLELGCSVAQGYYHAKPMPLDDVRTWLQTRGNIPEKVTGLRA